MMSAYDYFKFEIKFKKQTHNQMILENFKYKNYHYKKIYLFLTQYL